MQTKKILLVVSFFVISLTACEKSKTVPLDGLYGTWVRESAWDDGLKLHIEQTYKTDNTVEIVTTFNSADNQIFGYSMEQKGRFFAKGDSMITEIVEGKYLDQLPISSTGYPLPFSPNKEDLKPHTVYHRGAAKLVFSKDGNEISFVGPPCPINASCASNLPFKRLR